MYRHLDRADRWVAGATIVVGVLSAVTMVASLLLGVFYRYVLQASLAWSDEAAQLAFTWTVFLFASVLVREMGHVRVSVLISLLPAALEEALERAIMLLVLAFGVLLAWVGWQFMEFTANQVSAAMRYPLWLRNAALPAGGALIALHAAVLVLRPTPLRAAGGGGDADG
ncbi:TRAP transporter small permease [Arhodomonas sp. SL1]|uniref:TRAP transporter small permease n=1 Tax=Arhodomonas sp. SL1 TaxID=3425691 RepID=UPI003F8846CE